MEKLLNDYLVEQQTETGNRYCLTCTLCGSIWQSGEMSRETAAKEAGKRNHICHFCGRAVCKQCFANVEGIQLCVRCASRLRAKLDGK
jgi:hypothetical protein